MNYWPECIAFWHDAPLGLGYSVLFKWSPWGHKWTRPMGTYLYTGLYSRDL